MSKSPYDFISPGRLIALSDGVFAIAVTLLVFNLKVPDLPPADVHRLLPNALLGMASHFVTYVVRFLLIAVFWTVHHRMLHLVVHVDYLFIWINIFYLMVIAFIPFPSALMSTYPNETVSMVFYICCMLLVVGSSLLMWWYATRDRRLVDKDLPATTVNYFFTRGISTLIFFLVALPLAMYRVHWGQVCLLMIFPIQWSLRTQYKKRF